jgi:hypothetical protein
MHERVDFGATLGGALLSLLGLLLYDYRLAFIGALLIIAGYPLTELFNIFRGSGKSETG